MRLLSLSALLLLTVSMSAADVLTFSTVLAGDGSSLTNLNGSQLLSGTIPDARLSANVSLLGSSIDLSGAEATGILAAGRFPSLTGDITTSAGSLATTLATGNAGNLNSGTLLAARMPALTGDITTSAGAVATTLAIFPRCWAGTSGNGTVAANITAYISPNGHTNQSATDVSGGTRVPVTRTTTLQNLYVVTSAAVGSGKTDTLTIFTNGVASNIAVTISGTSQVTGNDTAHSVTVVAGTEIGVQIVTASASTVAKWSWSFEGK